MREGDFYTVAIPDWAVTLALTEKRELVMVQQYRFGTEKLSWELPAGCIEPGEDPLTAGMRELQEETGYGSKTARVIGSSSPNPAIQSNRCYFILAENVRKISDVSLDACEEIETQLVPAEQVLKWGLEGRIEHSIVLNALFYYAMHNR